MKAIFCLILIILSSNAFARKHISITGSSTVYPFTTIIAEEFGSYSDFKTPIVESTGTGGGMKLFCSGIGVNYPDFTNASRAIKKSEITKCQKNGISSPVEIKIGYDGIVLANSKKSNPVSLTKKQIFLAIADKIPSNGKLIENPYQKWSDIDKSLPNNEIAIYGPPSTSGTRDAFVELVLEKACVNLPEFIKDYPNKKTRKKICHIIRTDGKFIEAGENDNLIVQKLMNNNDALGIFGFGFLQQNSRSIQGVKINNIMPTFNNIISGTYSVSRPLFIYMKKEHLNVTPGMKEFVKEMIDEDTIGEYGYIIERGLIPMGDEELFKIRRRTLKVLQ